MDDVNRLIRIQNVNHLEEAASVALAPDKPFVLLNFSRERPARSSNHQFRLLGLNAMLGDVPDIPLIPAESHDSFMQENITQVNRFRLHTRKSKAAYSLVGPSCSW